MSELDEQRRVEVMAGAGIAAKLPEVLRRMRAQRVLVVATRNTVLRTGAAGWLVGHDHDYFHDIVPNPQAADVVRGAGAVARYRPDVVLGIGGGSTLDTAKAVRLLPPVSAEAERVLRGVAPVRATRPPRLVVIPTTAGPGSEVTTFATIYLGRRKQSLDHPAVRADVALIDPVLTRTCPPTLTAHCALDATAHAIESWWSPRAGSSSRALARGALSHLIPILRTGFRDTTARQRELLSNAAVMAGHAIDLTRTTAAHAFAYPTTAQFGVAHGLACALHLVWLLPFTLGELDREPSDSRMAKEETDQMLTLLGARTAADSGAALARLLSLAGCPTRLGEVGVRASDLEPMFDEALSNNRAQNHPIALRKDPVLGLLRSRL
ncbi:phosphonoacetaldehyde reductase [Streptomyces sp. NBC_00878]|uniref:phosphonoacetaldehyde reductase n=1 Tax=Streptomyces sp. NBC_00878 TaxID=2975854 RepID=UPI0022579CF2|nr:phosphonoacetaldehyde reductase [Streptomyces sp. NBC_00878]MCX4902783.1 phosphonoacetaldehyde reductase [Streptomyces sp. NBC_00878]